MCVFKRMCKEFSDLKVLLHRNFSNKPSFLKEETKSFFNILNVIHIYNVCYIFYYMNHAHKLNMDVRSKHSYYFLLSNLL